MNGVDGLRIVEALPVVQPEALSIALRSNVACEPSGRVQRPDHGERLRCRIVDFAGDLKMRPRTGLVLPRTISTGSVPAASAVGPRGPSSAHSPAEQASR